MFELIDWMLSGKQDNHCQRPEAHGSQNMLVIITQLADKFYDTNIGLTLAVQDAILQMKIQDT